MSNVTVTATQNSVSVNQATNTVTVTATPSNITVGTAVAVSNSDVRAALSNTSPITYNSTTGVIGIDSAALFTGKTTDDLSEGNTNLYFTNTRADARVNAVLPNTGSLTEGTNLYYTNARVQSFVIDSGLDFNAEKVDDRVANLLVGGTGISLSYDDAANTLTINGQVGDVTGVTAGSGLTGGGTSGDVTLNVGAGTGITVNTNDIAVNLSAFTSDNLPQGSSNRYLTAGSLETVVPTANLLLKEFRETTVAKGNVNGAVSFDQSTGTQFTATLTGNITGLSFPDIQAGGTGTLFLTQDAVGNRGFDNPNTYTNIKFANNYTTLSSNPANVDVINYIHDGTTTFLNITNIENAPFVAGDKGQKGETGPSGPQGPQGTAGDKGQKGELGPQGTQGPQGPAGPQGPQGTAGDKGQKGEIGATGPQGPQGAQGPQGSQGSAGDKGQKGEVGSTGPGGSTGPTGPQGPQGPAGSVSALNTGKIFLGSTSNTSIQVTPQNNFVTTSNAFNLGNALTNLNSLEAESTSDITLKGHKDTKVNTFIDSTNETEGITISPKGRAIKSTATFRGPNAAFTRSTAETYHGSILVGRGFLANAGIYFTAGSNVVEIVGTIEENYGTGLAKAPDLANTYTNGMVLINSTETTDYQSYTYPLSDKAFTTSLANSTTFSHLGFTVGKANVIMSEPSPVDFTWFDSGSSSFGRGIYHTLRNSDGDQIAFSTGLSGDYSAGGGSITNYLPVDKNAHIVSDNGHIDNYSSFTAGSLSVKTTPLTFANITVGTGFPTSSSLFRSTKETVLAPTQGSPKFSNIVLIGNDARYDDTMAGHIFYPSFGINAVWNGTDDLSTDTGTALDPPITTGMRFKQFTDKTIQDSVTSGNIQELSTGGARMLLGTANSNVSTNEATHRPIANQGIGVYGFFGSSEQEVAPRTRSMLPGGMYAVASETWTANTGTDMYFVSTPQGKKGIDTDDNEAHGFLSSVNGETSLFGTNKVSFFQSGNAYSTGNIVGGFNTLKSGTEWANISSTGIQTSGVVTATGNVSGGNVTTTGTIQGATTVLKKFNETAVALGNKTGDVSGDINATNGSIFTLTATGGITLNTIANAVAGTSATVIITQDGTGSHALTSSMKFAGGDKTLSTAGGAIDVISIFFDGSVYYASLTKAYA